MLLMDVASVDINNLLPWVQLPLAGIFFWLYLNEKKDRKEAESKLNTFLAAQSDKLIAYNNEQKTTLTNLTQAINVSLSRRNDGGS